MDWQGTSGSKWGYFIDIDKCMSRELCGHVDAAEFQSQVAIDTGIYVCMYLCV